MDVLRCVIKYHHRSRAWANGNRYGTRAITTSGNEAPYLIDWASTNQRRVSHSSYGAEILACSDADDRGFYLKQSFTEILGRNFGYFLHDNS